MQVLSYYFIILIITMRLVPTCNMTYDQVIDNITLLQIIQHIKYCRNQSEGGGNYSSSVHILKL